MKMMLILEDFKEIYSSFSRSTSVAVALLFGRWSRIWQTRVTRTGVCLRFYLIQQKEPP